MNVYKSSTNRMVGGVCAGFAEKMGVDPMIIRFIAAFLCLLVPYLLVAYLLLALLLPDSPDKRALIHPRVNLASSAHYLRETLFCVALCTLAGTLAAKQVFGLEAGAGAIASFALMALGVYMAIDGALENRQFNNASPKLPIGSVIGVIGTIATLGNLDVSFLSFGSLRYSISYLSPLFIIAVGFNLLFPSKRSSVAIWMLVLTTVLAHAFMHNHGMS